MRDCIIQLQGLFTCLCLALAGCTINSDIDRHSTRAQTEVNRSVLASGGNVTRLPTTCRAQVLYPALLKVKEAQVLVQDEAIEYTSTPATMEWSELRLQTEPARFPVETKPAQYREVTERIEVERERTELFVTPAVYQTVIRTLQAAPAYDRWKLGCLGHAEQCVESVPIQYTEVSTQAVDIPARTEQKRLPSKTVEVKRKILVEAGAGTGTPIPATYQGIQVVRVTKPWRIQTTRIPARYQTISTARLIRPAHLSMAPSLCSDSIRTEQTRLIQQQLQAQGYAVSSSGLLDTATQAAILKFQQDNGLATGAITLETLRKLGLAA